MRLVNPANRLTSSVTGRQAAVNKGARVIIGVNNARPTKESGSLMRLPDRIAARTTATVMALLPLGALMALTAAFAARPDPPAKSAPPRVSYREEIEPFLKANC